VLTGIMLLYVGATLGINGIWLIGQARAAARSAELVPDNVSAALAAESQAQESGGQTALRHRRPAPPRVDPPEKHFTFIQPKEIAVINFFTAGVGVVVATVFAVQGALQNNLTYVANAAYIMLFGFTYMFIGLNQLMNAGNRAFGWFCFFVAVTAIPTGIFTLRAAHGNAASLWLGFNWLIWACLWFAFFLLLTMDRPIMRPVGWATVAVAVATCWAFGYALLQGVVAL
jgi:putative amide transporter protein